MYTKQRTSSLSGTITPWIVDEVNAPILEVQSRRFEAQLFRTTDECLKTRLVEQFAKEHEFRVKKLTLWNIVNNGNCSERLISAGELSIILEHLHKAGVECFDSIGECDSGG